MGKRPRTPHFITGIGDGNVKNSNINNHNLADTHNLNNRVPNDDIFLLGAAGDGGGTGGNNKNGANAANSKNAILPQQRSHVRSRNGNSNTNERLMRLEEPLTPSDHWRDVFGNSGDLAVSGALGVGKVPSTAISAGPWQVSAFAILGMIVVISAIFLHMVSESTAESNTPYSYRRRQRHARRMYKTRKKKTDEWSDDEEPMQNGLDSSEDEEGEQPPPSSQQQQHHYHQPQQYNAEKAQFYPYYYQQPPAAVTANPNNNNNPHNPRLCSTQDHRLRRTTTGKEPHTPPTPGGGGRNSNGGSHYYHQPSATAYKSPSVNLLNLTPGGGGGVHRRGVSPKGSFNSNHGHSPGPNMRGSAYSSGGSNGPSPTIMRATAPLSGKLRVPTPPDARDLFSVVSGGGAHHHPHHSHHPSSGSVRLAAPPEESQLQVDDEVLMQPARPISGGGGGTPELHARPLNSSNFSSFASMEPDPFHIPSSSHTSDYKSNNNAPPSSDGSMKLGQILGNTPFSGHNRPDSQDHQTHNDNMIDLSFSGSRHIQQSNNSLLLSPGNYEQTPLIGNARKLVGGSGEIIPSLVDALQPPHGVGSSLSDAPFFPFIPTLDASKHRDEYAAPAYRGATPPRSVLLDELRLVQMETGNSMHWEVQDDNEQTPMSHSENDVSESHGSFYGEYGELDFGVSNHNSDSEVGDSDISIPSGDVRKSIKHKRPDLTMSTDAATSLQHSIDFEELKLQEVIGGGGFGQVWRATWRGTPVAVKVLTGSAQNTHIAKAILEEFKAEINLLKGMRHPNICLYMGASLAPPNRAIVTELAANGSVWDALRLPLMPPYVPADGTQRGAWPLELYIPDQHGAPPSSHLSRMSAPIPPKATWPWQLIKRVACGAARGMAYLHSGIPPVLHRDLKSANLLLDESYTTKVCDFGLSRLKAQERSMTGNCGTVQWMAPEVLANMSYNEKADVYSFGIILWELLSRECPYDDMTAIQCALAVLNRDKRPEIPKWCPPSLHALIKSCVKKEPDLRPSFAQIILALDAMEV